MERHFLAESWLKWKQPVTKEKSTGLLRAQEHTHLGVCSGCHRRRRGTDGQGRKAVSTTAQHVRSWIEQGPWLGISGTTLLCRNERQELLLSSAAAVPGQAL